MTDISIAEPIPIRDADLDEYWLQWRKVPPRAARSIHDGLRELLYAFGVVGAVVPVVVDESRPTAPNTDNAVPFAQRADRDRPDRWIETGDAPPPSVELVYRINLPRR